MKTIIFLLGIIEILICVVCFFLKKKYQMLICLLTYNIIVLLQYAIQGYITELFIILIDIVRAIIFFIFAYRNLKPNIYIIVTFEILVVGCAIFTWENWFSLFLLFASMIGIFSYWQKNLLLIRLFACISSLLVITNYIFTGLYVNIIAEAISFVSAIISIIVYRKELFTKNVNKDNKTMKNI